MLVFEFLALLSSLLVGSCQKRIIIFFLCCFWCVRWFDLGSLCYFQNLMRSNYKFQTCVLAGSRLKIVLMSCGWPSKLHYDTVRQRFALGKIKICIIIYSYLSSCSWYAKICTSLWISLSTNATVYLSYSDFTSFRLYWIFNFDSFSVCYNHNAF